jgi:hypothetical protein
MKRSRSLLRLLLATFFLADSTLAVATTCSPEGQGTHSDPKQNVLKNRDTVPQYT